MKTGWEHSHILGGVEGTHPCRLAEWFLFLPDVGVSRQQKQMRWTFQKQKLWRVGFCSALSVCGLSTCPSGACLQSQPLWLFSWMFTNVSLASPVPFSVSMFLKWLLLPWGQNSLILRNFLLSAPRNLTYFGDAQNVTFFISEPSFPQNFLSLRNISEVFISQRKLKIICSE